MAQFVGTATVGGNKYLTGNSTQDYGETHDDDGLYVLSATQARPRITIGQGSNINSYYSILRLGWIFDTSDIPTTAVIYSAFISFMLYEATTDDNFDITLVSGADLADDGLVWQDFGDLLNDTVSRGSKNTSGLVVDTWYDITLNDTGKGEITKGGLTKFGVRSGDDISSTPPGAPSVDNSVAIYATGVSDYGVELTVNYFTEPGYIWTEGDKLRYIPEIIASNRAGEQEILGVDTTTNATAGHLFVEGNYVHFISQNGDERRQMGKLTNRWGYVAGHIWIDDMWLYYIDSSGYERKLGTWMLGQSHLGVDTILHT